MSESSKFEDEIFEVLDFFPEKSSLPSIQPVKFSQIPHKNRNKHYRRPLDSDTDSGVLAALK